MSFELKSAKVLGINEFKKINVQITEVDFLALEEIFIKKFGEKSPNSKCFKKSENGNYYVQLSLFPWMKSNNALMNIHKKIDSSKPINIKTVIEFYEMTDQIGIKRSGMLLRLDKL